MRVMAHVKPERVRQKTVPRGLNRHQGGSVLFYARARVFPCTRLPQILRTRTFPLSGSTFPRVCVCVCVARASSAKSRYVLVFDARHTFFVTDPRQFGHSYDFFSSPRHSFSPSLHSLKAITSFSPFPFFLK